MSVYKKLVTKNVALMEHNTKVTRTIVLYDFCLKIVPMKMYHSLLKTGVYIELVNRKS